MSRYPLHGSRRLLPFLLLAFAWLLTALSARAEEEFLDPGVAFKFSARMADPGTVAVSYQIADGYYMYRDSFKFRASGAELGPPQIPPGKVKFDETFQKNVETYRHAVTITVPVQAAGAFTLTAVGQGCADKGLCYAPQETSVRLAGGAGTLAAEARPSGAGPAVLPSPTAPPQLSSAAGAVQDPVASKPSPVGALQSPVASTPSPASAAPPAEPAARAAASSVSELSGIAAILNGGRLLAIVPAFILLGLGLAFTPCVLPMVPILSSIIVGDGGAQRRSRGLVLSLAYSLGMAVVYTLLGVAAGLIGEGLAAALQNPWVLGGFGVLMVAMALSMFGVYELQLPASVQTKLARASGRQSSGKLAGVFAMGAISALIVGPCVAAPLAGALLYISQTRNVLVGGVALFALALGMSIPLLLVGVSAGSLLPRAGAWMDSVKRFFGVLMLAMALWLVAPVLAPVLQMLLWAALLLGYGSYLLRAHRHWAGLGLGVVCVLLGLMQLVGVASGGRDPLAPLAQLRAGTQQQGLTFTRVKTVAQLDAALARTGGKTALLDFYADWCVSCKEMEKLTFVDPAVKARLANTVLLQVDVTANDAEDKALLKRFHLFGPPGIILFDRNGREIPDSRIVGFQNAQKFSGSLSRLQ